jgi:predicted 3-demethylubiquinone-9 3-methyltransferase (glyoxalase superfamily)
MNHPSALRSCLWFEHDAQAAANYYVSLLPDSRIEAVIRPNDTEPNFEIVEFTLAGAPYMALAAGMRFEHTPAFSIAVLTDGQEDTDRLWDRLHGDGGTEQPCGWMIDRYGVHWQITPRALPGLFTSDDRAAAARAHSAMLTMKRIDIAAIERAFRGE